MVERTVKEIAAAVGGKIIGNPDFVVRGLSRIEDAQEGDLSFIAHSQYVRYLATTAASVIVISEHFTIPADLDKIFIVVPDAYRAFAKVLSLYASPPEYLPGFRHHTAVIDPTATIAESAYIGPYVVIGQEAIIDEDAVLVAHITIGAKVKIGEKTILHPGVVCYPDTQIGRRCIIHAGVVLGADGFGYIENSDGSFEKIPQIGNVVIEDDVEIGANTTIDRATVGSTVIGRGTKIDNLVHIAHNVSIGEHSALAAQTGIAGSTAIGKRNRFGGQAGVVGHITTADDVIVEAQSGVSKTLRQPGAYFGSPAKPHLQALKMEGALRQLPEILREFRELKQQVQQLMEQSQGKQQQGSR